MLAKVEKQDLSKLKGLFQDSRFYIGNSVLDGLMGNAYTDNIKHPKFAVLIVRKYCFISGTLDKNHLYDLVNDHFRKYKIIPNDHFKETLEELFPESMIKSKKYTMKHNTSLDQKKLQDFINALSMQYQIKEIDEDIAIKIKREKFTQVFENHTPYGLGFCCMYQNEIIGVVSYRFIYHNGIEISIRVKDEYRRQGIALALASKFILKCMQENISVHWTASNIESKYLAEKLGFIYGSSFDIYQFMSKNH